MVAVAEAEKVERRNLLYISDELCNRIEEFAVRDADIDNDLAAWLEWFGHLCGSPIPVPRAAFAAHEWLMNVQRVLLFTIETFDE